MRTNQKLVRRIEKKTVDELSRFSTPELIKTDQEQRLKFKKLATDNSSNTEMKGKPLPDSPEYAGIKGSSPNPCWCCFSAICLKKQHISKK